MVAIRGGIGYNNRYDSSNKKRRQRASRERIAPVYPTSSAIWSNYYCQAKSILREANQQTRTTPTSHCSPEPQKHQISNLKEMTIKECIERDLKTALLASDKSTATTLRGLKSVILDAEIAEGKRDTGLGEDALQQLLVKEVKKRKESIELYDKAGATDKADVERAEIDCINQYLPEQMSDEDVKKLVDQAVDSAGEVSMAQMGQIIGQVKAKAGPTADGGLIARLVKERLSA